MTSHEAEKCNWIHVSSASVMWMEALYYCTI